LGLGVVLPHQAALDDLQGQEVLPLLAQDPPQAGHVAVVELAVAGRRPLRVEEALALEEADLGDRDVGELVLEEGQDLTDREVRTGRHRLPQPSPPVPEKKTSLNLPICNSSPLRSGASPSMRSRLR